MSDLQKFLKLYEELGIKLKVINEPNGNKTVYMQVENGNKETSISDKFFGYTNCYSLIAFDKNEKFVAQGFFQEIDWDLMEDRG
jgi:hypothetical protein